MKKDFCFEYGGYCFFCVDLTAAVMSLLTWCKISSLANMLWNPISSVME